MPKIKANAMREAILDAASTLFIEHGFSGTSMYDIANALGVTRTAVYYYFKNKEAILVALTESVTSVPATGASRGREKSAPDPMEELRDLVRYHAKRVLSHPLQFRVVERAEINLPARLRESGRASRRSLLNKFTAVIEQGVRSGHFRVLDARIAAFAMIGMCNWTAWWYKPAGRRNPDEISEMLAEYALHALKRDDARRPRKAGVGEAVRLLREDLSYLEQQIHDGT